ncbi:MAG: hypothetical protein IJ572_02845 [Bacilli bacterium]|nr:hypothetical protein [Bacilli bacterium]
MEYDLIKHRKKMLIIKDLIIYFSRADKNYNVGFIEKGNTQIVAEYVKKLQMMNCLG